MNNIHFCQESHRLGVEGDVERSSMIEPFIGLVGYLPGPADLKANNISPLAQVMELLGQLFRNEKEPESSDPIQWVNLVTRQNRSVLPPTQAPSTAFL